MLNCFFSFTAYFTENIATVEIMATRLAHSHQECDIPRYVKGDNPHRLISARADSSDDGMTRAEMPIAGCILHAPLLLYFRVW
jgi:hypothetical protein